MVQSIIHNFKKIPLNIYNMDILLEWGYGERGWRGIKFICDLRL